MQLPLPFAELNAPLRQRVRIEPVPLKQVRWMLEEGHYLHRARVGRQINYAIYLDEELEGVITYAYPMISVPVLGVPSTEMLEFARLYLLRNVPHSATCAIGKSLRRIKQDWLTTFPRAAAPRLIISWSDVTYHAGTIYRAANFQWLRRTCYDTRQADRNTANAKRGFRRRTDDNRHAKDCWIYWLR